MPAFEKDLFDRKRIAERILNAFAHCGAGTILVDAPWGDGKTYFGNNFAQLLKDEYNASPVYIDAFKSDFVDDPFIMLAGSIYEQTDSLKEAPSMKDFLQKAFSVTKSILPTVIHTAAACASMGVLSEKVQEKLGDKISDGIAEVSGRIVENLISSYSEQKKNFSDCVFSLSSTNLRAIQRK